MTTSPITHQFPSRPGRNISIHKLTVKIESRLLALKLDMEMRRIVISEIHSDNDSEKR